MYGIKSDYVINNENIIDRSIECEYDSTCDNVDIIIYSYTPFESVDRLHLNTHIFNFDGTIDRSHHCEDVSR